MKKLYCPDCGEYLEGGSGDMVDCLCGWKQPEDQPEQTAIPAEIGCDDAPWMSADTEPDVAYRDGWNACRSAMLSAVQKPEGQP